jgi:peptide/nickel transport system permease protein
VARTVSEVATTWAARPRRPAGVALLRTARRHPVGAFGACLVLALLLVALAAPLISRYSPTEQAAASFVRPNGEHWFGTDRLGRDIYSRVVYGSRVSLMSGFASVALGGALGTLLGLLSGYFGRWPDLVIQRLMDIVLAFPIIILALVIITVLGASLLNVILAIAVAIVPGVSRVVRGAVLSVKENDYIMASNALGAGQARIMLRHILPNVAAPIIVLLTALLSYAILAEAALSYLGLGAPPPTPSWGADLSGTARDYFTYAPWLAIFPGVAISLAVLGFNLFGDTVRDTLDPRLRTN